MKKDVLNILYGNSLVGSLDYDRNKDRISLIYDTTWQFSSTSFPVSLSLPLARKAHTDGSIRPFLQGLLPDNPAVIEAWGKRFQVSPRNPFDIIKHVGEDCAGALQFVRPERLDEILSGTLDTLTPLSEADLARRMTALSSQSHAIPMLIEGRFSLAGAQTKDALHLKDGRWFVPGGRIPSTHILKPQWEEIEEHALNEHFCLQLASRLALSRAESSVFEIAGKKILCVKRYDRAADSSGAIIRCHQEDTCQAMGFYPYQKYQADGGPSAADITRLLERFSDNASDDIGRFVMALAFNWVIAGTDGHSKNYSILHSPGSCVRLAPLYDLASFLPYQRDRRSRKVKLAMKIGGSYKLHEIDRRHWEKWAGEADLSPDRVTVLVVSAIHQVLEALAPTRMRVAETSQGPFLDALADAISMRADKCAKIME